MKNQTISNFILSNLFLSPLFTKNIFNNNIFNCNFKKFENNFIYSNQKVNNFYFYLTKFSNFLNSVILISQENLNLNFNTYNNRSIFSDSDGNISINSCTFNKCKAENSAGGAIFIFYSYLTLFISKTTFSDCFSLQNGGAFRVSVRIAYYSNLCIFNCYCSSSYYGNGIASTSGVSDFHQLNYSYFIDCSSKRHHYGSLSAKLSLGQTILVNNNFTYEYSTFSGGISLTSPHFTYINNIYFSNIKSGYMFDLITNYKIDFNSICVIECSTSTSLFYCSTSLISFINSYFYANNGKYFSILNSSLNFHYCVFDLSISYFSLFKNLTLINCTFNSNNFPEFKFSLNEINKCNNFKSKFFDFDHSLIDTIVFSSYIFLLLIILLLKFTYQFIYHKFIPETKRSIYEKQLKMTLPIGFDESSEKISNLTLII